MSEPEHIKTILPRVFKNLLGGLDCPDMDLRAPRAKPKRKRINPPPQMPKEPTR